MKKVLCLCIVLFSAQVYSEDVQSLKGLDSPATKLDALVSLLYGQLGCKVKFSVLPISDLKPELCMYEIDYLLNVKTIRMNFSISENHHLVNDFGALKEKDKLQAISDIAARIESKVKGVLQRTSLSLGTYPPKMEFHIAHKGYVASRNNKGEIKSATYEVKGF